MEKEFIPYELALRMKALDYNEECLAYYNLQLQIEFKSCYNKVPIIMSGKKCGIPTFSQAFRWFREKYELHSFIDCKWKNLGWEFQIVDLSKMETISSIDRYNHKTPEEAELACLDKLIEIIESKTK
jgi:hypothetical protein